MYLYVFTSHLLLTPSLTPRFMSSFPQQPSSMETGLDSIWPGKSLHLQSIQGWFLHLCLWRPRWQSCFVGVSSLKQRQNLFDSQSSRKKTIESFKIKKSTSVDRCFRPWWIIEPQYKEPQTEAPNFIFPGLLKNMKVLSHWWSRDHQWDHSLSPWWGHVMELQHQWKGRCAQYEHGGM